MRFKVVSDKDRAVFNRRILELQLLAIFLVCLGIFIEAYFTYGVDSFEKLQNYKFTFRNYALVTIGFFIVLGGCWRKRSVFRTEVEVLADGVRIRNGTKVLNFPAGQIEEFLLWPADLENKPPKERDQWILGLKREKYEKWLKPHVIKIGTRVDLERFANQLPIKRPLKLVLNQR